MNFIGTDDRDGIDDRRQAWTSSASSGTSRHAMTNPLAGRRESPESHRLDSGVSAHARSELPICHSIAVRRRCRHPSHSKPAPEPAFPM